MPNPRDASEAEARDPDALAAGHCTPCRGGIPPLSPGEAAAYQEQLPEWELTDGATWIRRTFRFRDFAAAFAFVQTVAELAETEGHHPEISFGWGYCTIALQTMKIRGLHRNDFILAARIDDLMRNGPSPC